MRKKEFLHVSIYEYLKPPPPPSSAMFAPSNIISSFLLQKHTGIAQHDIYSVLVHAVVDT